MLQNRQGFKRGFGQNNQSNYQLQQQIQQLQQQLQQQSQQQSQPVSNQYGYVPYNPNIPQNANMALASNNGFAGTYHMPSNATPSMPVAVAPQPSPAMANAITYLQQIESNHPSPNPVAVTSNADNPHTELVRQIVSNCSPEDLAAALDAEVKKKPDLELVLSTTIDNGNLLIAREVG